MIQSIYGDGHRETAAAGYACFAIAYRGFGTSDVERGRLFPLEQGEDVQNAVTWLQL